MTRRRMQPTKHLGQPSWRIATQDVEARLTETGGHLGPVTFERRGRKIQPYSVAPWTVQGPGASQPPVINALRGDFFCLPFGGNEGVWRGERHPIHGEPANRRWRLESIDRSSTGIALHASMTTRIRRGRIDKTIALRTGHQALYCRHVISGMSGRTSLGHHAMLRFPDADGSGIISTSPFRHGQVMPDALEDPAGLGYSLLEPGSTFKSLRKVRTITGAFTDLSRYPARRGYEDLVMILSDPEATFAWTAVTFPAQRYVWFALKDPRVLAGTVFWISNGGRHYAPWSSRHVNVMGLEEVTGYFAYGLPEAARPNDLSRHGFRTSLALDPRRTTTVNYIMGIAAIPRGFDRVRSLRRRPDGVTLTSAGGRRVDVPLDSAFLDTPGE